MIKNNVKISTFINTLSQIGVHTSRVIIKKATFNVIIFRILIL
jgi:hypothetical protein